MKRTRVFVVLAGVALAALPAFGQLPVATLRGQVTTADNAPLPGATVTVSSPALQGTRSTTSGEDGSYLIGLLPPGDYRVVIEMQGFASVEKDVKLSAAQTTALDQEMVLEGVTEEIVVTGTYETISAGGQAATTYNYKEVIDKLPVNRNIRDAVLLTAGVSSTGPRAGGSRDSNISISGSQSHENLFLVNGVVVTENLRGQPFDLFIEDAIEETTTSTSAVSAEFGRFAGGVINTITKSGGNELHGSLRANLTNDDWVSDSNPLAPEREDQINETYEATLGGWLWRDKAWYFLAGRDLQRELTRTTGRVRVSGPTAGSTVTTPGISFAEGREQQRYEGKLTLSPFQGHRLTASYMEIDDVEIGNRFIVNVLDLKSLNDRETPQELRALNYNGVLTENFFVEAQYSEREFTFIGSGSRFTDRIRGTLFVDQPSLARWNSPTFCGVCRPEERDNENLLGKVSYFLTTDALGSHDLVLGYDTFSDIRAADNHQSGSDFRILLSNTILTNGELFPVFIPEAGNRAGTIIQFNPILVSSRGTDFTTNSIFLNDRWRLNDHWSFNLGVRFDENEGVNSEGQEVASDSKISPRLGLTWDPRGDGDWLFNASYGHYVAALANTQGDSTSRGGNPAAFQWWYRGPAINTPGSATLIPADAALQQLWDWFDAQGGINNTSNIRLIDIPGGTTRIAGGSLDSPHTIEYTIGATKRLGGKGLVRADLVHRDAQDFYIGRVDLSTGSVLTGAGTRANLELIENNDSVLEREYNGLHTQFQYRFTDRFNIGGVYTLSQAQGNWEGEIGTSGPIRSDVLAFPEYKELEWNAPKGDLAIDQRHRVRLFATYDVLRTERHSLNVGLLQTFSSGTPYGAEAGIPANFIPNPGYAIAPATVTYWFTDRDEFHTDDIVSTNLSLSYGFTFGALGKEIEIFVRPDILNVFDEDGSEVVNRQVLTAATAGSGLQRFNPLTDTPVEGVHWRKGLNFGKSTNELDLQVPRTYRVSLGFRF